MAEMKLGMASIEVSMKFINRDEAFRYAKRLREFIRYTCKNKADKGYLAQAMVVVSNIRGGLSFTL